jgi:L-fuconolactonase
VTALRIDAHQHFWRYDPAEYDWIDDSLGALRRDFLPTEAQRLMLAAGFDGAIAIQARQTERETRWLLSLADTHPFILGVVGWVDLTAADVPARLERLAHPKLVGIRHIVQAEPDGFLAREDVRRGIAALEARGLAFDILVYARQLADAAAFAAAFPRHRLVLDHLGKPDIRGHGFNVWYRELRRVAALPHVCAKLSGLVTEAHWASWTSETLRPYIDAALDCFGADRLMIGSDWPVCTVAGEYEAIMQVVVDAVSTLSAAERDAVLGVTAQRFWNLSRVEERA